MLRHVIVPCETMYILDLYFKCFLDIDKMFHVKRL